MTWQWAGPALAFVTFAMIGFGHVLVRRLHARYGTRPGVPFLGLGVLVLLAALLVEGDLLSGALGITAITTIWDGIEIYRQERRAQRGHL